MTSQWIRDYGPIAYTYEADTHCEACTRERFPNSARFAGADQQGNPLEDSEGNPVGVVASWDEWHDPSYPEAQSLVCGTCGAELDTYDPEA